MRTRTPFAVAFCFLCLASAYIGLAPNVIPTYNHSDKVLHFAVFFIITTCFYWIFETSFRRTVQLTVIVCTVQLGIGSEIIQHLLPNGRSFDIYDVVANLTGSLIAIAMCAWYHKRMLERRRKTRGYQRASGISDENRDVELGGLEPDDQITTVADHSVNIEQELNDWDENAEDDWDGTDEPFQTSDSISKSPEVAMDDTAKENKQRLE